MGPLTRKPYDSRVERKKNRKSAKCSRENTSPPKQTNVNMVLGANRFLRFGVINM